jgi:hypothetical protein
MKFSSKNRTTAMCKCSSCNCNRSPKSPANFNVANTYAKTKIANPTVVWDYKECIHPDIAVDVVDPGKKDENHHCPKFDFDKITKEDRSSRANRGRLNAMVLG